MLKKVAAKYYGYGLNALPTGIKKLNEGDRSVKVPFRIHVKKWQTINTPDILNWWDRSDMDGIGIATGLISGNLEVIDIDSKFDLKGDLWDNLCELIKSNIGDDFFESLLIETSPSGGYHILYRCQEIEGNLKLAWRKATPEELELKPGTRKYCLIETRGEGGFIVCNPTQGYDILQSDFSLIPDITTDERAILIDCIKSLDELENEAIPAKQIAEKPKNEAIQPIKKDKKLPPFEITPWEDFNSKNNIVDVLYKYGWTVSEGSSLNNNEVSMIYPGKKNRRETAAVAHKDRNLVLVYSTSAGLEAGSSTDPKGHKPFSVYCHYEHNNNKDAAIAALETAGYGKRKTPIAEVKNSRLKPVAEKKEITHLPNKNEIINANACWLVSSDALSAQFADNGIRYVVSTENDFRTKLDAIVTYTTNITFIIADKVQDVPMVNKWLPLTLSEQAFPSILPTGYNPEDIGDFFKANHYINEDTGEVINTLHSYVENWKIGWLNYRLAKIEDADACERLSEREKNNIAATIASEIIRLDYSRHPVLMGAMKSRHLKFVRDFIKSEIAEKKAIERKELLDNAVLSGVFISDEGTEVRNQYNALVQVCPYVLSYPYQLPTDVANECDWVVEVKGEGILQYLRIPNNKIGSVISVKNIFRNAKIRINIDNNQLDLLNSHLIMQSRTAEPVQTLCWHPEAKMWFFPDRAYCPYENKFFLPNEVSIIERGSEAYYLPYVDKNSKASPEILAFCYRKSNITFSYASNFIRKSWGDSAFILFLGEIATWFLDFVSVAANPLQPFFPLRYVQGKASSGKSTLAGLFKFFYASQLPVISLRMNNTQAGIVSAMQMARNITIPFDDYGDPDAQMNVGDVSGMLVSMWNLRVGLKMNVENFAARANSTTYSSAMVGSNYPPKDNSGALQTRLVYTRLDSVERTDLEMENFNKIAEKIAENGLNDALLEVISKRALIEAHFKNEYKALQKHIKTLVKGYPIESRVVDDYAVIGAVCKILMDKGGINIGNLTEAKLYDIIRDNIIKQYNALVQKEPLALFWEYIQQAYESGYLISGHHFDIDTAGFRLRDGTTLMEGEVLFMRFSPFYKEYVRICQQMGRKPEQESIIKTMIREHDAWEQKLLPDESRETSDVKVKKFDRKTEDLEKDPSLPRDFPTTCWALHYEKLQFSYDIDLFRMEKHKK